MLRVLKALTEGSLQSTEQSASCLCHHTYSRHDVCGFPWHCAVCPRLHPGKMRERGWARKEEIQTEREENRRIGVVMEGGRRGQTGETQSVAAVYSILKSE